MAIARIEVFAGLSSAEKQDRAKAVHRALVEALQVPEEDPTVLVSEVGADGVILPAGVTDSCTIVEVTLFAGRSASTKQRLYEEVTISLENVGVPRPDVMVVLVEVPREDWALWGGTPASQVELGFEVER
jgi:phenylpyruvate tautomerase PptA (4-oxalocrotonate tautomerase family)